MPALHSAELLTPQDSLSQQAVSSSQAISRVIEELSRLSLNEINGLEPNSAIGGDQVLLDLEIGNLHCVLKWHAPKSEAAATIALSPRETEIARMIAQGYPNKIIAAVLDISSWTVGTHVRHLFAKLGVTSRAAMVARISELGLLELFRKDLPVKRKATSQYSY